MAIERGDTDISRILARTYLFWRSRYPSIGERSVSTTTAIDSAFIEAPALPVANVALDLACINVKRHFMCTPMRSSSVECQSVVQVCKATLAGSRMRAFINLAG